MNSGWRPRSGSQNIYVHFSFKTSKYRALFSGSQIRVWRRRGRRRKKEAAVGSPLLLFAPVALAVSCGERSLVPLRAWHNTYFFNLSASRWCSPFSLSFSFLVKLILLAFLVLSIRVFFLKKWRLVHPLLWLLLSILCWIWCFPDDFRVRCFLECSFLLTCFVFWFCSFWHSKKWFPLCLTRSRVLIHIGVSSFWSYNDAQSSFVL